MHFIKNLVHDRVLEMLYFPTDDQVADIFTKSLTEEKFSKRRPMLGVHVDVFVTSECIHLYILCLVPRCLFWEVSLMYLTHFMPQCSCWDVL